MFSDRLSSFWGDIDMRHPITSIFKLKSGWNFFIGLYPTVLVFDKVGYALKNNQITMFSNTFPTLQLLHGGGGGGIKKFHPDSIVI